MPKRRPSADTQVDDILESHNPDVRALVERLRKIILDTVPDAMESAHPVWHSIGYRHPESGYFCGIFPTTTSPKRRGSHKRHLGMPYSPFLKGGV